MLVLKGGDEKLLRGTSRVWMADRTTQPPEVAPTVHPAAWGRGTVVGSGLGEGSWHGKHTGSTCCGGHLSSSSSPRTLVRRHQGVCFVKRIAEHCGTQRNGSFE